MKDENYKEFLVIKQLIKSKKYSDALPKLETVYKKEPNDHILKFELGKLEVHCGNTKKSKRTIYAVINDKKCCLC